MLNASNDLSNILTCLGVISKLIKFDGYVEPKIITNVICNHFVY